MGSRAQVFFPSERVYLYTHNGAPELPARVQAALAHGERWTDAEYLARIVFDEMTRDAYSGTIGFGIGGSKHGDIERLITLETSEGIVTIQDRYLDGDEWSWRKTWKGTFTAFTRLDLSKVLKDEEDTDE